MATSAVSPTTSQNTNLAQSLAGNQTLGQDEFLKLLVTQLTNQDPLSPQDDKEFLAQMAQFSTLQGVNNLGSSVDRGQAAEFLNKTVDATVLVNGATTNITGSVKAVTYQSDGAHLTVGATTGDTDVKLTDVTKVR